MGGGGWFMLCGFGAILFGVRGSGLCGLLGLVGLVWRRGVERRALGFYFV